MPLPSPPTVALIGAGRVGTAVTELLIRAGREAVGVASRNPGSAERAAARLGTSTFDVSGALPEAEAYLLGATDAGIAEIARSLAGRLAPGTHLVHFSGALDTEVLRPALGPGVEGYALHPVAACPDVDTASRRLPGAAWGITCSPDAEAWARAFVLDLGGHPVTVAGAARPLWHAASVVTSNGLSALLAVGEGLLAAAGIEEPDEVLGPLAAGSLSNAREGGGGAATLTGPFVRAESEAVARHLNALADHPEALDSYRKAAAMIVAVALGSGRLSERDAAEISDLLA